MDFLSPFLAGILAAFTPCVAVLIPGLVYRFSREEKQNKKLKNEPKNKTTKPQSTIKEIIMFSSAFLLFFIILAALLQELFTSTIQNGIQLGIGTLFVVLGFLAMKGRINPLNFPLVKNPFLYGIIFALLISVNPCTLGYLGLVIGTNIREMIILKLLLFGMGLLMPATLFAIFGNQLLKKLKKINKPLHKLNQLTNFLLIIMGIYLMYTIKHFGKIDLYVSALMLIITFYILIKSHFLFSTTKKIKLEQILLIISLILILLSVIYHCQNYIETGKEKNNSTNFLKIAEEITSATSESEYSCVADPASCEVCKRCTSIFTIGMIVGFIAILVAEKK